MTKDTLFDSCIKTPDRLLKHFQKVFDGLNTDYSSNIKTNIGPHSYNKIHIIEEIATLTRLARSKWYCVQEIVFGKNITAFTDSLAAREFINQTFDGIIQCLLVCDSPFRKEKFVEETLKHLKLFLSSVVPICKLDESIILKTVSSSGNNTMCPFYQYFHALLEVHYFIIVLHYICGIAVDNTKSHLEYVMKDIILFCKKDFQMLNNPSSSTRMCNCMKYFWLIIQLVTEKIDVSGSLFWRILNNVLDKEPPLFALNFLKQIAFLQCFNNSFEDVGSKCERIKPDYEFLESKIKAVLSQADCKTLIYSFKTIEPLLCNLWLKEGRIEIYQTIWDFYSKRLNVSNKSSCNISALQLVESLDTVLFCPKDCTEDFELFVALLLCHLREYPMQWGKMKGRIYSQLGPNKIKDLSEIGIRHVIVLFLALSSIHFEELEKRTLSFLENLPQEKKNTLLVWNMYGAVVLTYVREGRSIHKVASSMLHMLQEASSNQKMFHLIKEFINNLEHIVIHSTNMQLHQWLLIGPWLAKYQSVCYFADLNKSFEVILILLEKCCDADSWSHWEATFKDSVYPNLKQLAVSMNPPTIIGKIAGKLALLYTSLTTEAFGYFNSDTISPKISSKFLEVILDSYPNSFIITSQQENIIVQSWIKICLLTIEPQCDLTRNVIKLDIFPLTLKTHLKTAKDPIHAFIEYFGNNPRQHLQSPAMMKICELAFGSLDRTLAQYLSKPDSEEVVLKIYYNIALVFLNCGILIYNRNKPVTPLTKLIQVLILPTEFLVGKRPLHNFVLNAMKKSWHMFFEGLINLSTNNDNYLERSLKDMVVKYMPYFLTSDSPIVSCLDNPKTAAVVLEKMSISYFKPPMKESDANILKALKIVSHFAQSTTSVDLFKLLINKILYGLFEVVIFHNQRSSAIGVIKVISSSPLFPQLKAEFKMAVLAITERNLGLNTINYFQLLICLAKFVPEAIKELLGDIKKHVANVERLRGVGFDKTLRLHLEKLENALQSDF